MAKTPEYKLKYQAKYEESPERIKIREAQNRARYQALKAGKVHKGDSKDVDHIKPLVDGGAGAASNTRVVSEKTNRGWRKGQAGYDPGLQPKGKTK
jgi:hypothetical protein